MSKKICICTTLSVTLKSFVLATAEYLRDQCGYDITLVCAPDEGFKELVPNGVKYHPVNMARGIDIKAVRSIKELTDFFKTERFDMVQYSTPNASMYASIAAKKARVPIRLYCQWGIRYTGMTGVSRYIFKQVERLTCRLSTDIRSVSPMNRQFGINEGLYPADRVSVVGNGGTIGVDFNKYDITNFVQKRGAQRERYKIPQNTFTFGFCGRISKDKGSNELLRAFKRLVEEDCAAYLVLIGNTEANPGMDDELLNWATSSPKVIHTGKIPEQFMHDAYPLIDILVHPTYREGFGMVIQEAGALGIPCITTKITGASEVMVDGESCLLVEPKNTDELYKAMRKLYEDRELVKKLGEAAYLRTRTLYERSIMLENQRKDYVSLLGE